MGLFGRKVEENRTWEDITAQKDSAVELVEAETDELDKEEDVEVIENCDNTGEIDPLDCFFMHGEKSEKWLVKLAKGWHYVISVFWFFFGALTFAPVIYMAHKSRPIFKDRKKSLVFGMALYALIVILAIIVLVT